MTETLIFRVCLTLPTLVLGSICYGVLSCDFSAPLLEKFCVHTGELSSILSGYAFTVAGFLATIATFLFTLGGRAYFEYYKKRGSFDDLVFTHVVTLMWLAIVFCASIAIVAYPLPWLVNILLSSTLVSLALIIFLTHCAYNLTRNATEK